MRFTADKIQRRLELLKGLIYRDKTPMPPFRYQELPDERVPAMIAHTVTTDDWQEIAPGDYWGPIQRNFVMRTTFTAPPSYGQHAALYLPMGNSEDFAHPEALMYIDGKPFSTVDRFHQEIWLPPDYCDGQPHTLTLHGWTGYWNAQGLDARLLMRQCAVVRVDQPLRDLWVTANAAWRLHSHLSADDPIHHDILTALDEACMLLDTREPFGAALYASVGAAHAHLRDRLASAGAPLPVEVWTVGHAHIDVAWLWVLAQTRRKASRTFYSQLHLMRQFPDYIFTQSQPQLYEYIRQEDPALFERIQDAVAAGRWEPTGGMWVEADCNLSGSESLARQFLLGRRFFREHFGPNADTPVLWLPDVFGYSAQLPQLISLAGLRYFFTIKIGWSQYNHLPYDSFWWQGLDGTQVLTHFSTTPRGDESEYASTYNAYANPEDPWATWHKFKQKEHQRTLLMVFGWGDGGGGPTREMLENIREMQQFPGSPRTRHTRAGDFFAQLEREAGHRLPTWNGELYLEYHRGTYTTQSRNKRANRKAEIALHNAEFLCAYASVLEPGFAYPRADFTEAWRLVCLNQFHDIIPGSSIGPVYTESLAQYDAINQLASQAQDAALAVLAAHAGAGVAVNASPVAQAGVPAYSLMPASHNIPAAAASFQDGRYRLENDLLLAEFNADGDLMRLYDRQRGRDVLAPGATGNQMQAFEDRPKDWDAWDIDIFYQDRRWLADPADKIEVGPESLTIHRVILSSPYQQIVTLAGDVLRFDTRIDWRERHILLKVAFPVNILSPVASYDVQWGHVQRPTHWNTSWDWARFETVAHKWADLSEGDYGVSLLNDCKYGHDIRDNVLRLSLLKSPTWPDPLADAGEHRFAYGLYPHSGADLRGTQQRAYAFNNPLFVVGTGSAQPGLPPLVSVDGSALIETIKLAEDDNSVIVRLYETQRMRGTVHMRTAFDVQAAHIVNLLEDVLAEATIGADSRTISLALTPFQIVTLKLTPRP
jgi:alpha-mannosidase